LRRGDGQLGHRRCVRASHHPSIHSLTPSLHHTPFNTHNTQTTPWWSSHTIWPSSSRSPAASSRASTRYVFSSPPQLQLTRLPIIMCFLARRAPTTTTS
jgi:hypothetical protein